MITKQDTVISKSLIEKKLIAPDALQTVVDEASKSKESLISLLLKKGVVSEDNLLSSLAEVMKIPLVGPDALQADPKVTAKVPLKIAEYYKIVPLKLDKKKLTIAVSRPLDLRTQDDIRAQLGLELEIVLAREKDVNEAIQKSYGFAAGTIGEIMASSAEEQAGVAQESAEKLESIEKMAGDASIAKLVNQIILDAYRKRATDIHIEPYRGKVKLRYRVDGVLYNANVQSEMNRLILPVLSRIKIMSNLNIVERRLPQDGRAIVQVENTQLDLRVSSIPTPYGESVVIRILPMNRIFDLKRLGLSPDHLEIFENLINKPHGILFITGPTGSGKSTTLYACLNRINNDERKIITIEDPIEYEMEGVTQIQVQSNIGLDFARGLRSMLRHDPDVMMVGEVRDLETAEIAIRVALTGHLVFSTLHTNTAAGGITRLIDIGVPPYLVASSVEAFIAQRLVRVICPECKQEDKSPSVYEIKDQIIRDLNLKKDEPLVIYRGKGCHACNSTGFWGRVALYEVLLVNERIKQLIMKRTPASEIHQAAVSQGMRTLTQDGWRKVLQGLTTPEEIIELAHGGEEGVVEEEAEIIAAFSEPPRAKKSPPPLKEGISHPSDKRLFDRAEDRVNLRYRIVKLPGGHAESVKTKGVETFTVTRNLSAGGLLFVSKESLPMGAILEVSLELPDGLDPITCLARVVRVEEVGENLYETAICFLDLSRPVRSRLEQYVEHQKR